MRSLDSVLKKEGKNGQKHVFAIVENKLGDTEKCLESAPLGEIYYFTVMHVKLKLSILLDTWGSGTGFLGFIKI